MFPSLFSYFASLPLLLSAPESLSRFLCNRAVLARAFDCCILCLWSSRNGLENSEELVNGTGQAGDTAVAPAPAGVVVNPSPAIVKKVKKVVETRLDAPEIAIALQQLSEFYGQLTCWVPACERHPSANSAIS